MIKRSLWVRALRPIISLLLSTLGACTTDQKHALPCGDPLPGYTVEQCQCISDDARRPIGTSLGERPLIIYGDDPPVRVQCHKPR